MHLRSFIVEVNNKFSKVTSAESAAVDEEMQLLLEAGYVPETIAMSDDVGAVSIKAEPIQISKATSLCRKPPKQLAYEKAYGNFLIQKSEVEEEQQMDDEMAEEQVVDEQDPDDVEERLVDEGDEFNEEYEELATMAGDEENEGEIVDEENDEDNEMDGLENYEEPIEEEHLTDAIYTEPMYVVEKPNKPRRSKIERGCVHICVKCNKDFSSKTNLIRHMQTHDGVKPFQCNVCGNSFTQNGSLKQHMHIHTGVRPFVCQYCNRGFTQSKSLTFHMRRHTGEKPFKCEQCGQCFRQRDGLKVGWIGVCEVVLAKDNF